MTICRVLSAVRRAFSIDYLNEQIAEKEAEIRTIGAEIHVLERQLHDSKHGVRREIT